MTKRNASSPEPRRERSMPTTDAREAARLVGVRLPAPQTKAERRAAEAREHERAQLVASGDAAALYRFERDQRQGAAKEQLSADERAIDEARERLAADRLAASTKGRTGRPRSMHPIDTRVRHTKLPGDD